MERELFDWDGWDDVGDFALTFYNVVLKKDVGEYPTGTRFNSAMVDFQTGKLELYQNTQENPVATFNLHLTVGDQL